MTDPIDTSPEAIAALLDGVTEGWRDANDENSCVFDSDGLPVAFYVSRKNRRFIAAARELVPALAAEIARLTAERDEARAQVAMAYDVAANAASKRAAWWGSEWGNSDNCRHTAGLSDGAHCVYNDIRALIPADATAALARRDAAMRNEGRKVKPLVWERKFSKDWGGDIFMTEAPGYRRTIVPRNVSGGGFHLLSAFSSFITGDFQTIEAAKAAAQAEYEARILAALEPEGGE